MFTHFSRYLVASIQHSRAAKVLCLALCGLILLPGCSRFRHDRHDKVYVSVNKTYLHDRVAAVSNRVGEVVNGQQLEVLDHNRRFFKVKTEKNEVGWIEAHSVITSQDFDAFSQLADKHREDPVVATAVVRDDIYMHVLPGRSTARFYLLPENTKVQLLVRASVPKTSATGATVTATVKPQTAAPKPATGTAGSGTAATAGKQAQAKSSSAPAASAGKNATGAASTSQPAAAQPESEPILMEDWWLVRDGQGHTGWMLSNRVDVDVPDAIGVYAEGQKIVGAYVLTKIFDSESSVPDHMVPEYITVLCPNKSGLPYDYDQVRIFTWSIKRHRYETAFRMRNIQGFLPVKIGTQPAGPGKNATVPAFSIQIPSGNNIATDPSTGISRPASTRTIRYTLVDTSVKRIGPDFGPIPTTQSDDDKNKKNKQGKKGR